MYMPPQSQNLLIMFIKAPHPGAVKTRLQTHLSPQQAALLYQALVEDQTEALISGDYDLVLFFSPVEEEPFISDWLGSGLRLQAQHGGDLGARMHNAFLWAFRQGYKRTALIGSDVPDINQELILHAFTVLGKKELVIGPSEDGGYYLIGLRRPCAALFENMTWSVDSVCEETLRRAGQARLTVGTLVEKRDIDSIEDVRQVWRMHRSGEIKLGKRTERILKIILGTSSLKP